MVNCCVVWGCTNRAVQNSVRRHFFDIPKNSSRPKDVHFNWPGEGYNPDPSQRHHKVCSDHFITVKYPYIHFLTSLLLLQNRKKTEKLHICIPNSYLPMLLHDHVLNPNAKLTFIFTIMVTITVARYKTNYEYVSMNHVYVI
ncbi:hypothetical protein ACJMK2_000632 [Sinanodonta woodiana]|uniref:THAP-type domain-containing protein n=1 Tax=Sinanodonta woodiana TaxID=1069815 RepID=A0ABD3XPZ6_SINWO